MWGRRKNYRFSESYPFTASRDVEKIVKTLCTVISVVGVTAVVSLVFLAGYGVHRINKSIPINPDTDLAVLEELLTRKLIVLTREQKEKLAPIIRELRQNENIPEKVELLKQKMWAVLGDNVKQEVRKRYNSITDKYNTINKKYNILKGKYNPSEKPGSENEQFNSGSEKPDSGNEKTDSMHEKTGSTNEEHSSIAGKYKSINDRFKLIRDKYDAIRDKWRTRQETGIKDNLLRMLEQ